MTDQDLTVRTQLFTAFVVVIILVSVLFLFLHFQQSQSSDQFQDDSCRLNESGMLIDPCIPLFRIVNGTNSTISEDTGRAPWGPAPPINESQKYIDKALEPYGGIPKDAVLSSVDEKMWSEEYHGKSVVSRQVTEWCAYYHQPLYGKPVLGSGSYLTVCIKEEGKPSTISKHWTSVEEAGLERIITSSEAIERLKNRDGRFNPPTRTHIYDYIPEGAFNLTIMDMELRYYASENSTNRKYLEPVWRISTVDMIRRMQFIFYIPASYRPEKYAYPKYDLFGSQRTFSQIGGNLSALNITPSQFVMIGTSGPIGKDAAEQSVRQFIENPELNLTYNGRYRIPSDGCDGGYQGEYYSFNTTDCEFSVDVFSGSMIGASIQESCIKPGFSGKSVKGNITREEAESLADRFVKEKYPYFEKNHIERHSSNYEKSKSGDYYSISYWGRFGTLIETGLSISVNYRTGLIVRYSTDDEILEYMCSSTNPVSPVNIDE